MALTNAGRDYMAGAIVANPATLFNAANAHIGVGDSSTAFNASQTDLQAPTNKVRNIVDGAPTNSPANVVEFVSTFGTSQANFAWNEWAIFNNSSGGTMLNRVVESPSLGTKTSAQSWEITCTLTVNAA